MVRINRHSWTKTLSHPLTIQHFWLTIWHTVCTQQMLDRQMNGWMHRPVDKCGFPILKKLIIQERRHYKILSLSLTNLLPVCFISSIHSIKQAKNLKSPWIMLLCLPSGLQTNVQTSPYYPCPSLAPFHLDLWYSLCLPSSKIAFFTSIFDESPRIIFLKCSSDLATLLVRTL